MEHHDSHALHSHSSQSWDGYKTTSCVWFGTAACRRAEGEVEIWYDIDAKAVT